MSPQKLTPQAVAIWFAAMLTYTVGIVNRTSFGVASVDALNHFHIDAGRLAVFTSVQVGTYALAQIPVGLAVDRFGPRKVFIVGALMMAVGQVILGSTTSYPIAIAARVLIGAGDASGWISVLRIIPAWIPVAQAPIFMQAAGSIGQLGQFISAVPFVALLRIQGWNHSFVAIGCAGVIVALCAALVIRDTPSSQKKSASTSTPAPAPAERMSIATKLRTVASHSVCWEAFFTHWIALVHQMNFTLLWGVPLMTMALGLDRHTAGIVLVVNTVVTVLAGPFAGIISARMGQRRALFALWCSLLNTTLWVLFFCSPTPPALWMIVCLNATFTLVTPVSNFGFDEVREHIDHRVLATATGLANMGGFTATMLASQGIGIILSIQKHGQSYSWGDFRVAWLALAVVWAAGVLGFLVSHRRRRFQLDVKA